MSIRFEVDAALAGSRLDAAVAERVPELSRARARRLIEAGAITVSGKRRKPSYHLGVGELVTGELPEPAPLRVAPEPIPLDVRYEDEHLLVVNKPAGLVVHPAAGHAGGTLVNALLYHCEELSGIGGVRRPGIVHRLDKGTSGLLLVAKSDRAHLGLAGQLRAHTVLREYLALVRGGPRLERGAIDAPIGRHPRDRKKFSTKGRRARQAHTSFEVEERLGDLSLLRVRLATGRTHQIRVHLASAGWPVAGDPVYGGGRSFARELGLKRQALHAAVLGFMHPVRESWLRFEAELPPDLESVLQSLRARAGPRP